MNKLVKFSESDVNNLRSYMQKNYRNNISFVNNCPIVYKNNIEYDVCNIVLSQGAIYFHCVKSLDCLNNGMFLMTDLSSQYGTKLIYKAISLTDTISELSDEEIKLRVKFYDKFASLLKFNDNEIISDEKVCGISNINGYFTFTKIRYDNDTIKFYDKDTETWVRINQLTLKVQIILYNFFKEVVKDNFFDLEYHPMLGDC